MMIDEINTIEDHLTIMLLESKTNQSLEILFILRTNPPCRIIVLVSKYTETGKLKQDDFLI